MDQAQLITYLNGHATKEEARAIEAWIQADQANEAMFLETKKIWEPKTIAPHLVKSDIDKAWQNVRSRTNNTTKTRIIGIRRWSIAASVLILIAVSYFLLPSNKMNTYATQDIDGPQLLEMPDGSKVWLNAFSTLEYPKKFKGNERKVKLSGQAFFDVERSESQPFIIETEKVGVKVLGTSFDVMAYPDSTYTEVLVASGKVAFYLLDAQENNTILEKDQGARLIKSTKKFENQEVVNPNKRAWYTQQLYFKDTPLANVLTELEQSFEIKISIAEEAIGRCLLNGSISISDQAEAFEVIATLFDLEVEKQANRNYLIKGEGCK
ncbi:MAG: FecR domain-containing protein [Bacteroidota bacterium]